MCNLLAIQVKVFMNLHLCENESLPISKSIKPKINTSLNFDI